MGSGPSPKRRGPARFYLPPAEHQEETWKDAAAPREGLSSSLLLRAQPIEPRQEVRLNSSNSANLKETSGSGEFPHVFPMCFLCILLLICHADQKRWRDSNYFTQNLTLQAGCSPKAWVSSLEILPSVILGCDLIAEAHRDPETITVPAAIGCPILTDASMGLSVLLTNKDSAANTFFSHHNKTTPEITQSGTQRRGQGSSSISGRGLQVLAWPAQGSRLVCAGNSEVSFIPTGEPPFRYLIRAHLLNKHEDETTRNTSDQGNKTPENRFKAQLRPAPLIWKSRMTDQKVNRSPRRGLRASYAAPLPVPKVSAYEKCGGRGKERSQGLQSLRLSDH